MTRTETGSEYIRWAKSRERFRYNLGRSSIRPCPVRLLAPQIDDLRWQGDNAHGWRPLREALAARYSVDTDSVTLAIGASMANHLACAALIEPDDHVLVESPGYEPLRSLAAYLGGAVESFARRIEDGFGLDVAAIADSLRPATRLVVVSDLHNPSGRAVTDEAFADLAQLAERHGFDVLVDEVYREFLHRPGLPVAANRSPRFISTCSLTKAYGLDGLRAGWVIARREVARRMRRINDLYGIIMPHPTERLALRAVQNIESLQADVAELLDRNRPLVAALIDARRELHWEPPNGGPVGFVRVAGTSVDALVNLLESEYDATLPPGRFFGLDDHFRIAFGMSTDDLAAGLDRLGAALDRVERKDEGDE